MLRTVCLLILVLSAALSGHSQSRIPQFRDYPPDSKYGGKNAPVIITRKDRMYRTRLTEAAKEKPNFAGHYILTAWGCGAGCLMGAVIDANTGKVYGFPHTICCWNDIQRDDKFSPIEFRINSRLVVFSGVRNEAEGDQGTHFYEFDGSNFKLIRSVKAASYEAPTATPSVTKVAGSTPAAGTNITQVPSVRRLNPEATDPFASNRPRRSLLRLIHFPANQSCDVRRKRVLEFPSLAQHSQASLRTPDL